jgi:hypothetical protein
MTRRAPELLTRERDAQLLRLGACILREVARTGQTPVRRGGRQWDFRRLLRWPSTESRGESPGWKERGNGDPCARPEALEPPTLSTVQGKWVRGMPATARAPASPRGLQGRRSQDETAGIPSVPTELRSVSGKLRGPDCADAPPRRLRANASPGQLPGSHR